MIRLDLSTGLTGKQIEAIIKAFETDKRRFDKMEQYYNNQNIIMSRFIDDPKPNNKIAHSFCKYISNMATGYFMGRGIRFVIEDEAQKSAFDEVLDEEYTKDITFEIAKEASKCGVAYELLYINEESKLRSKMFGAKDFIPIHSNRIGEFLEGAIRIWEEKDLFSDATVNFAALYTKTEIITYRKGSSENEYTEIERVMHCLDDVPVIVYQNNKERKGDFEDVISLVDAYDKAQSDTANDFEYFTDAYLTIIGAGDGFITDYDGDGESGVNRISVLKQERILYLDEKGQADWLIKNINDIAVENYKDRIKKDLFFLAQVPALSDESFGQNLSGVAIKYKLIGLEELSVIKENKFRASLKKKLKLVTAFINLNQRTTYNANDIQMFFDRNLIENLTEVIENVSKLEGITSKETQLGLLPFVDKPREEFEKMLQEQQDADNFQTVDDDDLALALQSDEDEDGGE